MQNNDYSVFLLSGSFDRTNMARAFMVPNLVCRWCQPCIDCCCGDPRLPRSRGSITASKCLNGQSLHHENVLILKSMITNWVFLSYRQKCLISFILRRYSSTSWPNDI